MKYIIIIEQAATTLPSPEFLSLFFVKKKNVKT